MPAGGVAAYEVWNEEDETQFWGGTPNPAQYAAILKATYPAIKSADPQAKVLLGPLTGNNYDFLSALYDNGAQGSFDAASVHTDTRLPGRPARQLLPRRRATSRASRSWASARCTT